ncbi:hypothetical protein O3G_MSEX009161 [Manduca sexta]|uniref:Gustatory receptor n=1 Tax=Manduca sexta TaxID=7130 RepID=A0A921ZD33_MANSE|nr:hypothetical protein O3G_MSEX009161 [Manduca sexta]KAG6455320.1 hypothetical protein O3G_MSEX009161 [Manduca sexta]
MFQISSLFGLAPLRFKPHEKGFSVSLSSAMCVYSYILVTLLVILAVFGMVAEIQVGVEFSVRMTSRITQVVSTGDMLVVVVTACAGVYGAPKRMRIMLGFMEKVASVDNSIGCQYSGLTERKLCAILLAILIFFTVLIADDFCFYALQATKVDRELDLPRCPPLNIYAIRVSPVVSQRSANVSLLVDSMPTKESTVIIKRIVSGEPRLVVAPCEAIRRLAVLYGTLCEVVHSIDDSYGLPLIVIIISTLLHLIITPYFLIMELIVSTNRIHFLVLQFLWCGTHMLRMFVLVEPCHYTANEGKRTESLICRLMTSTPSNGVLPSRLELFSRQLMLQSVNYSPMGMCTLDRPLVASVIGAVTTYLVILIQFQRYGT